MIAQNERSPHRRATAVVTIAASVTSLASLIVGLSGADFDFQAVSEAATFIAWGRTPLNRCGGACGCRCSAVACCWFPSPFICCAGCVRTTPWLRISQRLPQASTSRRGGCERARIDPA